VPVQVLVLRGECVPVQVLVRRGECAPVHIYTSCPVNVRGFTACTEP
jgi:hypothetical protein